MSVALCTDRLFVISDLHLGGAVGAQIFDSSDALQWWVQSISKEDVSGITTLLINGDFVDFLAEPNPTYFDPLGAVERLKRIFLLEPSFKRVLLALRSFVKEKNNRLVINIGNHDLEFGLPWVYESFMELLDPNRSGLRSRVSLKSDGSGVLFQVGGKRIYCSHGNDVDNWNVTDYEAIRRIAKAITSGRHYEEWVPNAGTQLVIDVINEIKRSYPFVELVKPEGKAVVPILAALQPSLAKKLSAISAVVTRKVIDSAKIRVGFLGGERDILYGESQILHGYGEADIYKNAAAAHSELIGNADRNFCSNISPMDLVRLNDVDEQLGIPKILSSRIFGKNQSESLRAGLQELKHDRSFDLGFEDQQFNDYDSLVGTSVDVIVTGHTHLMRALKRRKCCGYYFNTGTWARLINIDSNMLDSPSKFEEFLDASSSGGLESLDKLDGVVMRENPFFSAGQVGEKLRVGLSRVISDGLDHFSEVIPETEFIL